MRQHVNPLSRYFQLERELPKLDELFDCPDLPLHLDIGSARGYFLLKLASLQQGWNHLGIEIRQPLADAAEKDRYALGLSNLSFLFANANVSLGEWLSSLPNDTLQKVSIQFPDPWFKRRHRKRKLLQPDLLLSIASSLDPGRELFVQTDLIDVIESMKMMIDLSNCFSISQNCSRLFSGENPFPVRSEREIYALNKRQPIYRILYIRNERKTPEMQSFINEWKQI